MSQAIAVYEPEVQNLIVEESKPVDSIFSAKQQRLLTDPLYSSWGGPGPGRRFLADSNVGIFYMTRSPAIVPDMFLSLDIESRENTWAKEPQAYLMWEFGKPPDVIIEVVSNKVGGEATEKKLKYAHMRVAYYVIFDPGLQIGDEALTVHRLDGLGYRRHESARLHEVNLGLTVWRGEFEDVQSAWLRWTDKNGDIIPTGRERAEMERAEKEKERGEKEAAQQRAARLSAMLRRLGRDPDEQ